MENSSDAARRKKDKRFMRDSGIRKWAVQPSRGLIQGTAFF
jgi:hypothetical protein